MRSLNTKAYDSVTFKTAACVPFPRKSKRPRLQRASRRCYPSLSFEPRWLWEPCLKAHVRPSWQESFHLISGGATRATAWSAAKAGLQTLSGSYDGSHPPSSLPSRGSEALPASEAETWLREMELEIVIIDKRFL